MLYEEPPVASGSSVSFPSGGSPSPIPIPPPSAPVLAANVPVPSLGLSSSDKENSSVRTFQFTQQVVNELVEIVEADLEVDSKEAQALSDAMDTEVRSCLTSNASPSSILIDLLHSLKAGRLIELMSNDDDLFTSHRSRLIESSSSGPGTSKTVLMATQTLRVMTPKVVLGSRQGLFLPEGHPLLNTLDQLFATFGVQGRIHWGQGATYPVDTL